MGTYTDWQQRVLDQTEIKRERKAPDTAYRERMRQLTAEALAGEMVEALQAAVAGDPHWRREAQALLRRIDAGDYPEPPEAA